MLSLRPFHCFRSKPTAKQFLRHFATNRDKRRLSALPRELAWTGNLMIFKQEEEREFHLRSAGVRK